MTTGNCHFDTFFDVDRLEKLEAEVFWLNRLLTSLCVISAINGICIMILAIILL